MKSHKSILVLIVFGQFCCTSLWFASNSVINDLAYVFNLSSHALGHLTSSVQFGFISGTLVFALVSVADRFSPSKVFCVSALLGALFNSIIILDYNTFWSLIMLRFATGFFLAGVYPVGMKIAADYFEKRLDQSLGFLVGALVLGTAFPHLVKALGTDLIWTHVILTSSCLSVIGGLILFLFVPDGPFRRPASSMNFGVIGMLFKEPKFRSAAFGYFGHMWELYTFWAFVPIMLSFYSRDLNVPLYSFIIIGIGSISCIAGGFLSARFGEKTIASCALGLSGICCLLSGFAFGFQQVPFVIFLTFWGIVVIMDSPLFSTLVAHSANPTYKATALTIVNCIGFAITILSIQLLNFLLDDFQISEVLIILAIGPVLGLLGLWQKGKFIF